MIDDPWGNDINGDRVTDIIDRKLREALAGSSAFANRMSGSRDQLHQMLDQVLDLGAGIFALARPLRSLLRERAVDIAGRVDRPLRSSAPVDVLALGPVSPGGRAEGRIEVRNDGDMPLDGLRLQCAGLVTDALQQIAGQHLALQPVNLDLAGRSRAVVNVRLDVPQTAQLGSYVGVITARGRPFIQAIVTVEVL